VAIISLGLYAGIPVSLPSLEGHFVPEYIHREPRISCARESHLEFLQRWNLQYRPEP
jgi:hypothetical protein